MKMWIFPAGVALLFLFLNAEVSPSPAQATCRPTRPDALGPFYTPNAPVRSVVGKGYRLQGTVRSAKTCDPITGARIEFWLTGPSGDYDDAHRATVYSDGAGKYAFESNLPLAYAPRPPHIHIRVSADRYGTLVTQHYPETGSSEAGMDLVLFPAP